MSVNKVILIGNVGKDPEVKHLQSGFSVSSFSLATSESYTNKSGEKVTNTEWHNISVLNDKIIPIVEKYVLKGSQIYIEGKIKTRSWDDKDGVKKYSTEIVLDFNGVLQLLGGKQEQKQSSGNTAFYPNAKVKQNDFSSGSDPNDLPGSENDLPF